MPELRVLIVGASIAGPMAAYWFAKAGATVTVIERFPRLRSGGQNIDIRLTGVTVMRKIPGMEDAVRAALAPLDGVGFVDKSGKPIATMRGTGDAEQQSLVSEFEIFRGELSRVLVELTKDLDQVKYIFGEHILSIAEQPADQVGPAKVQFANGTPDAEFDLVVACDGATSRTRAMAFGCSVRDHISPMGAWAAYFTTKNDLLNGGRIGLACSAPGGRALTLGPDQADANRAMAMRVHSRGDDPELDKFRLANKEGTDELKRFISQRFQDVGWKSPEIIAELMDSDDLYASELCQVKISRLFKGRVVLVGDAGYAAGPTGTGTSLAMAGAYVLAGEISKHGQDIEGGLKAYQERMQPIIKDMHVIPSGVLSFLAPQTSWGIVVRNLIFFAVCWASKFAFLLGWLGSAWGAAGFGKDKYDLPDYNFSVDGDVLDPRRG